MICCGLNSFIIFLLIWIKFFVISAKSDDQENDGKICKYFDDHKRLGKCYEEYMELYNISHNEITYDRYIEKTNKYFKSWKTVEKLCQNFMVLKKCIGNEIIKNCINLEDFEYIFMNLDHKNMEQLQYVINFHQFNYICGLGFEGYKKSFNCINKLNTYCGGYGTTCEEAKKGIECSSMKAEKECGKNGFEYIKNIFSIGLCYSRSQCGKDFCQHEKIREIRDTVNLGSKTFNITVSDCIIDLSNIELSSQNFENKTENCEPSNIFQNSEMRTRFYASYNPYQNWEFPDSLIYYILKNPSTTKIYLKLTKSCKYFFIKNPFLIYRGLCYCDFKNIGWTDLNGARKNNEFTNVSTKFWVDYQFDVYSINDKYLAASVIPKISKSTVKYLSLHFQILSFEEIMIFTPTVDFTYFECIAVINKNGTVMEMQEIFELFSKVQIFQYSDDLNAPCITSKTFKELIKISHFQKLDVLNLYHVPEAFDIESFYVYMKNNKRTAFNIDFQLNPNLSEVYKARLQSIVDEIVETEKHEYKVPYLPYEGNDIVKRDKMLKLGQKGD